MNNTKKLRESTNELFRTSIGGMSGMVALGALSNTPGMPKQAKGIVPIAGLGVQLGTIGATLNVARNIVPEQSTKKKKTFW